MADIRERFVEISDIPERFARHYVRKSQNEVDIHILMARRRENPEGGDNRVRRASSDCRERIFIHRLNPERYAVDSQFQNSFGPDFRNVFGIRLETDFDVFGKIACRKLREDFLDLVRGKHAWGTSSEVYGLNASAGGLPILTLEKRPYFFPKECRIQIYLYRLYHRRKREFAIGTPLSAERDMEVEKHGVLAGKTNGSKPRALWPISRKTSRDTRKVPRKSACSSLLCSGWHRWYRYAFLRWPTKPGAARYCS